MSVDATSIVEQWCARWSKSNEELCQAFRDQFAAGAKYYVHQDTPPATGAEEAVAALDGFKVGFDVQTIDVDILRIAQVGNDVWTTRVDHCVNSKGERIISIPIAGVMTFNDDGLLTEWHDYWDMRELGKLASP